MKLLVATNNPGKLREYRGILERLIPDIEMVTLAEAGIEAEAEETGATFEANARQKAVFYSELSGMPVIADDSGIEVAALGGEPGIHSARWTGPTDADRNRALLTQLEGVPPEARGARFVCVSVLLMPDGRDAVARGEVAGRILDAPRGDGGFGYDPLFYIDELGQTMAELPREQKNTLSHRARAAEGLAEKAKGLLGG